jgi:uncharacterized protein (TIGR02598 family)
MEKRSHPSNLLADWKAEFDRIPAGRRAFSLVETTLALGLVTFAAVSILALLPTGLNVMRAAMDQTVEAQIVRSITGQAVVTPFEQLEAGGPFYFNNEGVMVDTAGDAVYTVTVSRHAPNFPGSTNATQFLNQSLANLHIQILEERGATGSGRTNIHSLHVANYGK